MWYVTKANIKFIMHTTRTMMIKVHNNGSHVLAIVVLDDMREQHSAMKVASAPL